MRVLHVENSSGRGGSLRSLRAVMPPPPDVECEILQLERQWTDDVPLQAAVHRVRSQSFLECRRILGRGGYDLVHVNNAPFEGRSAILAARWEGIPVVSHMRTNRRLRKVERWMLRGGIRELWVLSEAHRRRFDPKAPVRVLHNPVEVPVSRTTAVPGRLGVFGTLKADKGQDDLLRACAEIDEDWSLVVAGGPVGDQPSTLGALEVQARELGIADRVRFTGHLENPFDEMAACSIIVDASRKAEGLRRTVIEGLLSGRHVLATRVGGIEDVLDERNLVPPGDVAALRDGIRRLLAAGLPSKVDPELRETHGSERCRSEFWSAVRAVVA